MESFQIYRGGNSETVLRALEDAGAVRCSPEKPFVLKSGKYLQEAVKQVAAENGLNAAETAQWLSEVQ